MPGADHESPPQRRTNFGKGQFLDIGEESSVTFRSTIDRVSEKADEEGNC